MNVKEQNELKDLFERATLGWIIANCGIKDLFERLSDEQKNKFAEDMMEEVINLPGLLPEKLQAYTDRWDNYSKSREGLPILTSK